MRVRLVQVAERGKPCVHELTLSRSAVGRDVREKAADFAGVPIERIRLYRRGVELCDATHLCTVLDDEADCLVCTVESAHALENASAEVALRICGLESLARVEACALQAIQGLLDDARAGLLAGQRPVLSEDGSGGTYFLRDARGKHVACFKPRDEEPAAENNPRGILGQTGQCGLRQGVRAGEAVQREVAAFITDFGGFSGVPETVLVEAKHSAFNYRQGAVFNKTGSFQRYVHADCIASDLSPNLFPAEEVHKIALLDIRMLNSDRNDANLLVSRKPKPRSPGAMPASVPRTDASCPQSRKFRSFSCSMGPMDFDYSLTPIDHGYCLPDKLEVAWCDWCWLDWPQAHVPFSASTLRWIEEYDVDACIQILQRDLNVRAPCLQLMRVVAMVMKKGARAGLCLHDIASIIARQDVDKPSVLETQVSRARELAQMMYNNSRVKGVVEHDMMTERPPRDNAANPRRVGRTLETEVHQRRLRHRNVADRAKSLLVPKQHRRVATLSSCNLPHPTPLDRDFTSALSRSGKENSRLGLPRMSAPSYEELQSARRSPDPANDDEAHDAPSPSHLAGSPCSSSGEDMLERFFLEYVERLVDDVILCVQNHRRLDQKLVFRRTSSMHLTSPHRHTTAVADLLDAAQHISQQATIDRRPRCTSDDSFFPEGSLRHDNNLDGGAIWQRENKEDQHEEHTWLVQDSQLPPPPQQQVTPGMHHPNQHHRGAIPLRKEESPRSFAAEEQNLADDGTCTNLAKPTSGIPFARNATSSQPQRVPSSSMRTRRADKKPAPLDISLAEPGVPQFVRIDAHGTKHIVHAGNCGPFPTRSFQESKDSAMSGFADAMLESLSPTISPTSAIPSPSPATASPPSRRSDTAPSSTSQKLRIPLRFLPV